VIANWQTDGNPKTNYFSGGSAVTRSLVLLLAFVAPCSLFALDVSIAVKAEGGSKPVIVGTTNLPDDTELMITISRAASAYSAQDTAHVSNGAFRVGPFTQGGAPLNPGIYKIEVSSPLASLQPSSVRSIIGADGSKMHGPLVKKSQFGGMVIEHATSFKVGSGNASQAQDQAARAKSKEDRHAWWLQSCTDVCNIKRAAGHDWNSCYQKCVSDEPKTK
jgi:hypothetical protein